MEYLSNHLFDHTPILNISLDDQTTFYKSLKWRQSPMEDNLICKDDRKVLGKPSQEKNTKYKLEGGGGTP